MVTSKDMFSVTQLFNGLPHVDEEPLVLKLRFVPVLASYINDHIFIADLACRYTLPMDLQAAMPGG